jgi:hypothetical protein
MISVVKDFPGGARGRRERRIAAPAVSSHTDLGTQLDCLASKSSGLSAAVETVQMSQPSREIADWSVDEPGVVMESHDPRDEFQKNNELSSSRRI